MPLEIRKRKTENSKRITVNVLRLLFIIYCSAFLLAPSAQAADAPVIFFTDLTSGPNTGGEPISGYSGAYVTLYGNFLDTPTSVTWNGVNCLRTVSVAGNQVNPWLWYQRMIVQMGASCPAGSGNFVITTAAGTSNGVPFTVRSGNIYFVATTGSDANDGSFAHPWQHIPHAVQTAGTAAGNTIYVMNGVQQTADDGQGWSAAVTLRSQWCHGTQAAPDALASYPGMTNVQVGPSAALSPGDGLRGVDFTGSGGACGGYWTFAGINFRGTGAAAVNGPSQYWRFVGNDLSNAQNPGGGGGSACFEITMGTQNSIYGNYFHDMNLATTDHLAQGLYLSTDANFSDVGWNLLYNAKGRAGLQTHSSPLSSGNGYILHDIAIHDNIIHGTAEEAILVDTVDPSQGPVRVYNNVIYGAGQDGSGSDNTHMQLSGDFDQSHGAGSGWIEWYNNTVYCQPGSGNHCWGSGYVDIHDGRGAFNSVHNELLYSNGSATYWAVGMNPWSPGFYCNSTDTSAQCPTFRGSNNLVYGNGPATFTTILTNNVNADPLFANLAGADFHLQSNGSPAIGHGAASWTAGSVPAYDIDGRVRPSPPAIGAYEYAAGVAPPPPPPSGPAPVLFFTDLDSGPKTGGENGNGAYVTLYGSNLGPTPTVTVGGGSVLVKLQPSAYLSYQKMTIQLGASAATGNIVVTNSNGSSNALPFTVTTKNIYFVATGGSDSASGSIGSPWASLQHGRDTAAAGDIVYVRAGTYGTTEDNDNAGLILASAGSATAFRSLIAYPGESVTIGQTVNGRPTYGVRSEGAHYWIVSGFHIVGISEAMESGAGTDHVNYIGNDFSDPQGAGQAAAAHFDTNTNIHFYGNYVHDVGTLAGAIDKFYHAVYFTTNSNHIWVGWNTIFPNTTHSTTSGGCRAIQFYSTGGSNQFDLHVHDNVIHDAICDGINFATVDPSQGVVEAYNNVVYHVGTGPDPYNGSSNYSCVLVGGGSSGAVDVYNNSFYDCGSRKTSDAGALDPTGPSIRSRNNIIDQLAGESYINANTSASQMSGSNTLWFGAGNGPTQTTGNINADPKFTNAAGGDFTLQSGSPALGAGVNTGICADGAGWDIGACAASAPGAITTPPGTTATPTMNPNGGNFTAAVPVTLQDATTNALIYFTLNGSNPTLASPLYNAIFTLSQTATVKAIAYANGQTSSVATAVFTINIPGATALPLPDLSGLPSYVGSNDTLSLTNYPNTNVSFLWSFTPSSTNPYGAPSAVAQALSESFKTGTRTNTLTSYGLGLGAYQVSVQAVDNTNPNNLSNPAFKTITLINTDFSQVKIYPNPWRIDKHAGKNMTFANLPLGSTVKLFTVSGREVKSIGESGGQAVWNLSNDGGDKVASGVYVYLITVGDTGYGGSGQKIKGKVAVIK